MKPFSFGLTCVVLALAVAACCLAGPTERPVPGPLVADRIEAGSIVLASKDGKHKITISAGESSVGIWVGDAKSSRCVCLVAGSGPGPFVGLFDEAGNPCSLAFSLDGSKPTAQVGEGGKVAVLPLAPLAKLLKE